MFPDKQSLTANIAQVIVCSVHNTEMGTLVFQVAKPFYFEMPRVSLLVPMSL